MYVVLSLVTISQS